MTMRRCLRRPLLWYCGEGKSEVEDYEGGDNEGIMQNILYIRMTLMSSFYYLEGKNIVRNMNAE